MADTESKTTITDELKAAAAKLRQVAGLATYGPWRRAADVEHASGTYGPNHVANWGGEYLTSVADPGEGLQADRDAAWICLANPLLAEPLAAWLEKTAHDFDVEVEEHRPDCCGDVHEESGLLHMDGCGWVTVYRDHGAPPCGCFANALAVARVLNGTTPQEVALHG